eukprot:SAG31_NODE_189_length_20842_cov_12.518151_19_plen_70_part_00
MTAVNPERVNKTHHHHHEIHRGQDIEKESKKHGQEQSIDLNICCAHLGQACLSDAFYKPSGLMYDPFLS